MFILKPTVMKHQFGESMDNKFPSYDYVKETNNNYYLFKKDGIYEKSSTEKILAFRDFLNEKGIVATVRRELGSDISAACGQLVRQNKEENQ